MHSLVMVEFIGERKVSTFFKRKVISMLGEMKINKCTWNWHIRTYSVLSSSSVFLLSAKIITILTKVI